MTEEDEAFEELALKQGHWQHTSGWRKKQIMETSMKQDEIIEMAIQAHYESKTWIDIYKDEITAGTVRGYLEAFAKLVAEAEREACAKVCESYLSESPHSWGGTTMAAAIRARGQA
jgi:hypothetical protein